MRIFISFDFKRQLKRLKKRFPHAKSDVCGALDSFVPARAVAVGNSVYKLRIASSDMSRGKSSGFRTYVYFLRYEKMLAPFCIYAKSDRTAVPKEKLELHFDATLDELMNFLLQNPPKSL